MRIQIHSSTTEIETLWRNHEKECDLYVFQTFDWVSTWYHRVGRYNKISAALVVVGGSGSEILMILPFGIRKWGPVKVLSWLADSLSDYHSPLCVSNASALWSQNEFQELWRNIRQSLPPHDVVQFQNQPEWIGSQKNPFVDLEGTVESDRAYSIKLHSTMGACYQDSKRSRVRSDSVRQKKRLEALGKVSFEIADNEYDRDRFITFTIDKKVDKYLKTGVRSSIGDLYYRNYFHELAQDTELEFGVQVSALLVNDEPIACHWGLLYRNKFYYSIPAYDPGWGRYSPGRLLLEHLIEWSIDNKYDVFDLAVGAEPYKQIWKNEEMRIFEYLLPTSSVGALYIQYLKVKTFVKQVIRGM